MAIPDEIVRWGGGRLSRKLATAIPWVGAAIALVTVAGTMRRKGVMRGGFDTALNATPILGAMKNVVEAVRGRDFIPDRPAATALPR